MNRFVFSPADILLYNGENPSAFSVVACDQYTSEPQYWAEVRELVGKHPSALHLIFPEADFKTADFDARIMSINVAMTNYLNAGLFSTYPNAIIYTERTLKNGKIRRGLIGRIDLEEYQYTQGSTSRVRATEGTVLERIPPRVRIRKNAPLELPHVMLLIDDASRSIIEPLESWSQTQDKLYDFDLMMESGHLRGYLLDDAQKQRVVTALESLADEEVFFKKYGITGASVLQYAVGDGNHSLATAKKAYLELKERIGVDEALQHPARYALVEVVNLYDESLEFEAIHRVLFDIEPQKVLNALEIAFSPSDTPVPGAHKLTIVQNGEKRTVYLTETAHSLAVGDLQSFLDEYLKKRPGEVDYIHGEDVVLKLSEQPNTLGFILEPMTKEELFPSVIVDGALPRKTFSMGEACDKRFYWEARKIKQTQE